MNGGTLPSMVAQLEDVITASFYAKDAAARRQRAHAAGLQSPVWLWTHQSSAGSGKAAVGKESKDVRKCCHLVEWLLRNRVDPATVAVLVPLAAKTAMKTALSSTLQAGAEHGEASAPSCPVVLAQHELSAMNHRDDTSYTYDVVLYVFGLPAEAAQLPLATSQASFISEALGAARSAFVLVMDGGWVSPALAAKWPAWKNFLSKLQEEQPPVSAAAAPAEGQPDAPGTGKRAPARDARLPCLVSSSLPLCCARHPSQRQLEYGLTPIVATCKHFCLAPYDCGVAHHLCAGSCHPSQRHTTCPFACSRSLPCGHACLQTCASRCNCCQVVEKALPCSHQVVLGLDPESLEPIYGTVQHVFRGVCADAGLPCAVEYATECARCLGPLTVKCFEAQQQDHTRSHRTMVCASCRRAERELRSQILGEVLYGAEDEKKRLKVEMKRVVHQQRKAAAQGLFVHGVKVEITDATKCVPPLFAEEDFPGVRFADMDDPAFFTRMEGACGTFISSHVDVMDRSELRNLVRLPDGAHVLVTDGGLRMIRVLTDSAVAKSSASLLLTFHASSGAAGQTAEESSASAEFDAARALVGRSLYLSQPVPCAEAGDAATISNKVVTAVAIDPLSAANVVVECQVARRQAPAAAPEAGDPCPPETKRARVDAGGPLQEPQTEAASLRFVAPIAVLEPLRGYGTGEYVYVISPERQVRDPRLMGELSAAMHAVLPDLGEATLSAAPVDSDTAYELLAVLNPPLWLTDAETTGGDVGPCAVLRPRALSAAAVVASHAHRGRGGRSAGSAAASVAISAAAKRASARQSTAVVAVPFLFTLPDELTEAENALDATAQQRFERRLEDAVLKRSEELSLRHDEDAFHAQQQMGRVTAERQREQRTAYSVPVALMTAEEAAEAKRRHLRLPVASAVTARIAAAKDTLAGKKEPQELDAWMQEMRDRFAHDADTNNLYIKSLAAQAPPGHSRTR